MGFASAQALRDLYLTGAFCKCSTISFPEIYGLPDYPPEALVADKRNGNVIGECWTRDLQDLVTFGEKEQESTGLKNPNLPIIKEAIRTMEDIRKRTEEMGRILSAPPQSAKIIPFPALR